MKGTHDEIRRLRTPLGVVFASLLLLTLGSMYVVRLAEQHRHAWETQVSVLGAQRSLVGQYEASTYLALAAIERSEWELLVQQRLHARRVAEQFSTNHSSLLAGGRLVWSTNDFLVARVKSVAARKHLATAAQAWEAASLAQVSTLRSRERDLNEARNESLRRFREHTTIVAMELAKANQLVSSAARARSREIALFQLVVQILAATLILLLAGYVYRRMFVPLGHAMFDLAEAKMQVDAHLGALERAQSTLMRVSRQAGMAEVAIGVLHNVGNVLTSTNVSLQVLKERLTSLKTDALSRTTALFEKDRAELASFLVADPRGAKVVPYLAMLTEHFKSEQVQMLSEVERVRGHLEHVSEVVDRQQTFAKKVGVLETCAPSEIIDDALRVVEPSLTSAGIRLTREYRQLQPVELDRHKVLQILINLLSNAKHALRDAAVATPQVWVRAAGGEGLTIEVEDNGIGIASENLPRIFGHGFTTKARGHGFGLHSSVLAAQELGGTLRAASDGPGKGARFTLEVPARRRGTPQDAASSGESRHQGAHEQRTGT